MSSVANRVRGIFSDFAYGMKWAVSDRSRHYRARVHRMRLRDVIFVGVTGSAGKTTTKDLAAAILAANGPCQSSVLSRNDHELVDKTVLSTRRSHRYSVVEMGASGPGYLDRSLRVVRPHIGVLTVVAAEQYSAFRQLEAVALEKRKIVDGLPPGGIAVLNRDDMHVRAIGESRKGLVIWVGRAEGSHLRLVDVRSRWPEPLTMVVEHEGRRYDVDTRLHGVQLATPALCALGVALAARIPLQQAIDALARADGPRGRMQIETLDDEVTFVRDDFKAPQWSFQAPLEFLRDAQARRKVAVIGTISDTPQEPSRRYAKAAREALAVADLVLLVGSHTLSTERANRIRSDGSLRLSPSVREASAFLKRELRAGDLVLLKGTNKADHLVRIVLDRRRSVRCWESSCRRTTFCSDCTRVYRDTADVFHADDSDQGVASSAPLGTPVPIVVGLGNPGERFRGTVHNVGQRVLDRIAEEAGQNWTAIARGLQVDCTIAGAPVVLMKLNCPMNRSGVALKAYLAERGQDASDCIVVFDDADLPLGEARIKRSGGDAGHKGVRSILEALGTDQVLRVRIGVRGDAERDASVRFVLSRFDRKDELTLDAGVRDGARLVRHRLIEMQLRHTRKSGSDG